MQRIVFTIILIPLLCTFCGLSLYVISSSKPGHANQVASAETDLRLPGIRLDEPLKQPAPFALSTSLINQPIPTNTWWSSVLTGEWPETLFSLPFATKLSPKGLSTSAPLPIATTDAVITPFSTDVSLIYGNNALADKDIVLAHDDFSVSIRSLDQHGQPMLDTQIIKGSPFLSLKLYRPAKIAINAIGSYSTISEGRTALYAKVSGVTYGIYAPTEISTPEPEDMLITPRSEGSRIVITALPQQPSSLVKSLLESLANNPVQETSCSYSVSDNTVTTDYLWKTQNGKPTAYLILPNQQTPDNMTDTYGSYQTIRGKAYLGSGLDLKVRQHTLTVDSSFALPSPSTFFEIAKLESYLQTSAAATLSVPESSYEAGKSLTKLANLLDIAEKSKSPEASVFLQALQSGLEHWLTYTPGEQSGYFYYDQNFKGIVGKQADFGSEKFNDHHFHYGYFLNAAATLATYDPQFVISHGKTVDLLAKDIANTDRTSSLFPPLRYFDVYEGHSWADGLSKFADGNNQESASEAVNAWYGLKRWGEASNQPNLTETGTWLYNMEARSELDYNFNLSGNPLPKPYAHTEASQIWGGKSVWATWFSETPEAKHMILYLPLTPASAFLASDGILKTDRASLVQETASRPSKNYADILLMARALYDPIGAQKAFAPDLPVDTGNSLAYEYYWLAWASQHAAHR